MLRIIHVSLAVILLVATRSAVADTLTPAQAAQKEGERVTVEFTVKSTGTNPAGFAELYSADSWRQPDCFFIRFPEVTQQKLKKLNIPDVGTHFSGHVVRVTGQVQSIVFSGEIGKRMAIYVNDLDQIEVMSQAATFTPTSAYRSRQIAGFTVLLHPALLQHPEEAAEALQELESQLTNIIHVLPMAPLATLRHVRIWMEWDKKKEGAAEFHPSAEWLRGHGYNPEKAGDVELSNPHNFVTWSHTNQPWMVLHEFAHAYHHRVLGQTHAGIEAAYKQAMERKLYESVDYVNGDKKQAYAATNAEEYFAELTEAYFGQNDFYPFTRADLQKHDPVGYQLMQQTWGIPLGDKR